MEFETDHDNHVFYTHPLIFQEQRDEKNPFLARRARQTPDKIGLCWLVRSSAMGYLEKIIFSYRSKRRSAKEYFP